jgi:ABC-type amino acid transport substrate-binding protein
MPETRLRPALAGVFVGLLWVMLLLAGTLPIASAQATRTPVPLVTLVPPTLVPPPPSPTATQPPLQSALARVKARISANNRPTLIVGLPYNVERFASLTTTGSVAGFEADLAQAIADDWGVDLLRPQVTRQNAVDMLLNGQIDLLMGQVIVSRDTQTALDFSDPIFVNKQVALVLDDASARDVKDLGGQAVGVVIGSRSEQALAEWSKANNIQVDVKRYPMLDDGIRALFNREIVALVGGRWELDQKAGHGLLSGIRLLSGVFRLEPYAIAMRRYDDNLRTLVDRTLQRLQQSKRLDPIYNQWFPKDLMPVEERVLPRVWANLDDDKRVLSDPDFPVDIIMPAQPVVARIKSGQPLRVAGLGAPLDSSGRTPILEALNQALITEMARRWGAQVQLVPNSYGKGEDAVASGQADLAVGVEPHWGNVDRVDFAGLYAEHSYRLMTPFGSTQVRDFGDLFAGIRRNVAYFADDPGAVDLARTTAEKFRIPADTITFVRLQTDNDAIQTLAVDHISAFVFGDSLRLYPIVQANPKFVQFTDASYGAKPISFAVPRNDADFRVLVEVTLQEMAKDGTYQRLWQATFPVGNPLSIIVWPGSATVFGIKTTG